ncbi:uncharacterized protein LOC129760599 [Uranotaenia lowii]|uniref:uncharacterized protein LOC129760599 n=1 Tax=Uranotaenia lowii TaxID=190385 RepID=UPI00247A8344|nr:uncharacterized protein LOC129760599 [Uranotaenia lowii]
MSRIKRRRLAVDEREEEENLQRLNRVTPNMNREFQSAMRPLHPEEIKPLIAEFSGECSVGPWLRKIQHYQRLYCWSDSATLLYAATRLTGSAKLWYSSVEEQIDSFQEFRVRILAIFPNFCDDVDVHRELMGVIKFNQESYENYVFRVQNIASKGEISQTSVIKYILSGLSRDKLYEQVVSGQYKTVFDLLKRLKWCESNIKLKKATFAPGNSGSVSRSNTGKVLPPPARVASAIVCFNCSAPGHRSIDCPRPQRRERCTVCMKVGYTASVCNNPGIPKAKPMVAMVNTVKPTMPEGGAESDQLEIETDEEGMLDCEAVLGRRLRNMKLLVDSGSANE